jgi:hypothetical protein
MQTSGIFPVKRIDSVNAYIVKLDSSSSIIKVCMSAEADIFHQEAFILQTLSNFCDDHPEFKKHFMGYTAMFTAPLIALNR